MAGLGGAACAVALLSNCSVLMPSDNWKGQLPLAKAESLSAAERMRRDVEMMATTIGFRNLHHPEAYQRAEDYLIAQLVRAGYSPRLQRLDTTHEGVRTQPANIVVEVTGTKMPQRRLVIGAHYDTFSRDGKETPGANDNASGCAALLELARRLKDQPREVTIELVLFANEEPPFFWTDQMGSLIYARSLKASGAEVVGMISLDTMGVYSDEPNSQKYPPVVGVAYPSTGNFVAFVGTESSAAWIKEWVGTFRSVSQFPAEGAAMPMIVPRIGSSDHWSFWKQGWPSLMVTDTAIYRSPHYHQLRDTAEKLDYERMARVVDGIEKSLDVMARVR